MTIRMRYIGLAILMVATQIIAFGQCGDPAPCINCNSSPDCILCDISVLDGYCYTLPNEDFVAPFPGCPNNVLNNDRWFGFIASATFVSIQMTASNCQGGLAVGVHGGLYADCNGTVIDVQCACVNGAFTLSGNVNPGQLYWIVMDGCAADICDIDVDVLAGAGNFMIPDPESINGVVPGSGDTIQICWGFEDFSFVTQDLFGAQEYEWVMPDGSIQLSNSPNSPPYTFDQLGVFEVCVSGLHYCDTTDQICVPINVYPLPPDTIRTEICENDPCVPFDNGECYIEGGVYDALVQDGNGCFFDRTLILDVFPENDTLVYDVICEDDLPFELPDGSIIFDAGSYNSTVLSGLGCDSTVITELAVLGGEVLIGDLECIDGLFRIVANLDLFPYVQSFEASWENDQGQEVSDTLSLEVTEGGTYTLYVTIGGLDVDDSIEYTCFLEPFSIDVDTSLFIPGSADTIYGDLVICEDGIYSYWIDSIHNTDAETYEWTVPPGAILLSEPDSLGAIIDFTDAITGLLCVTGLNDCGSGPPYCQQITIIDLIIADAGPDVLACGPTYTMQAIMQGSGGLWTLFDGPGSVEFEDISDPHTEVTVDPIGEYSFIWRDTAGTCNDQDTVMIQFLELPYWDSLFTIICDGSSEFYTIEFQIEGGQEPYNLVIGDGELNGNIFLSDPILSDSSYYFEISDAFNCGPIAIAGNHICLCLSDVGIMGVDTLNACVGESILVEYIENGEYLDNNDTCTFILHDYSGDSIGVIWDVRDVNEFDFINGMVEEQSYFISKVVGNEIDSTVVDLLHHCTKVAPGQPVIWRETPMANAGPDTSICDFVFDLYATPSIGNGEWKFISGPSVAIITDINDPLSQVSLFEFGNYIFVWTETHFSCSTSDTMHVFVLDFPIIDQNSIEFICNDTMTAYTVSFDISKGDISSYMVNGFIGGTLTDDHFKSNPIPSGNSFFFIVSDAFACNASILVDSFTCPCITQVGSMEMDTLFICEDQLAIAHYNDLGQVFDANDTIHFALHEGNANNLESIISINDRAEFNFIPNDMNYGQVYYISPIVGDELTNFIDTLNPCHQVGIGQAVIFYQIPVPSIDAASLIITCSIESIELSGLLSTPIGQLDFLWSAEDGGIIVGDLTLGTITVTQAGTYILEVTNGACIRYDTTHIDVSEDLPLADAGSPATLTCDLLEILLDGSNSDSGPEFEYSWIDPFGDTIGSDLSQTISSPGIYTIVVFNTLNGCKAINQVNIDIDTTSPDILLLDIGFLTCSQSQTTIDASGSDSGPSFQSIWTTQQGIILSDPTQNIINVSEPASYTLTIENEDNGCISSKTFDVIELANTIQGAIIEKTNVSCFGQKDGLIYILSVTGGIPPLMYSIDGGENYSSALNYSSLPPGLYQLQIIDSLGCMWSDEILISEPPLVDIQLSGDAQILIGENTTLIANHNVDPEDIDTIIWTSPNNEPIICIDPLCEIIQVTPSQSGEYSVTVISKNGCSDSDQIALAVIFSQNVYVPNVFSPNQDGINDLVTVHAQENALIVHYFRVYNRWGELVFSVRNFPPNDPTNFGWDGRFKGETLNPAVYTFVTAVEFLSGQIKQVKGDILLIK